jgi:hypothetical protein
LLTSVSYDELKKQKKRKKEDKIYPYIHHIYTCFIHSLYYKFTCFIPYIYYKCSSNLLNSYKSTISRCPFQLKAKSKKSYSHFLSNCFESHLLLPTAKAIVLLVVTMQVTSSINMPKPYFFYPFSIFPLPSISSLRIPKGKKKYELSNKQHT